MYGGILNVIRLYVVFWHMVSWVGFILVPLILIPKEPLRIQDFAEAKFMSLVMINHLVIIIYFYWFYFITVPKLYFKGNHKMFLLHIVIGSLAIFSINLWMPDLVYWGETIPYIHYPVVLAISIVYIVMATIGAFGLRSYEKWQHAEKEKLKLELSYLKAQFNPHFIFNTLNGIYSLALQKADTAAPAIARLSSIMRYLVDESFLAKVPLSKEVAHILDYIELQKLRLTDQTKVIVKIDGITDGLNIEPLILMCFVENAFKHGVSTEIASSISIHLMVEESILKLIVVNRKFDRKDILRVHGIGMDNVKKRLEMTYAHRHTLKVLDQDGYFELYLQIELEKV